MGMKEGWQTFVDLTKAKAGSHMKTARYWESVHNAFSLSLIGEGFLFCGSRKLTYFHGGKRKYNVISTDFGHKNSDGNGNIIF